MLYENIFKALHLNQVEYVVIGGIAVNLHGFARATGDLDIVLSLTDKEISKFIRVAKEIGLVPRLPVKMEEFADAKKRKTWIKEKNMKVFSVYNPDNPMEHIDVMVDHVMDFKILYENRVIMKSHDLEIPVASIPNLIQLKRHAGRERDFIDIKALERIEELKREK